MRSESPRAKSYIASPAVERGGERHERGEQRDAGGERGPATGDGRRRRAFGPGSLVRGSRRAASEPAHDRDPHDARKFTPGTRSEQLDPADPMTFDAFAARA